MGLSLFEVNKLRSHAPFKELLARNEKAQRDCIEIVLDGDVSDLRAIVLREQIIGELRGLRRLGLDLAEIEQQLTEQARKAGDYEQIQHIEDGGRSGGSGGGLGGEPVSGGSSGAGNVSVEPKPRKYDENGRSIWDDTDQGAAD